MTSLNKFDIVGIGVSTMDVFMVVDKFLGEEGVQRAHEVLLQGGGPIATALVAASRLGSKTAMLDSIGSDWIASKIIDEFKTYNVCTDYIARTENATSSIASVSVRKDDGCRTITYCPGTAPELAMSDGQLSILRNSKIVHINGRHLGACLHACEFVRNSTTLVSFDGGAGRYRPELDTLLKHVQICILSIDFAQAWLGESTPEELTQKLIVSGCMIGIITMGERGSVGRTASELIYQPAYMTRKTIDTTGCGDVYHGAFLSAYLSGFDFKKSLQIASAAASIKSQCLGGRGIVPDLGQIIDFIDSHDQ